MQVVITYREQGRKEFPDLVKQAFGSAKKFGYRTVLVGSNVAECDHYIESGTKDELHLSNWILYARQKYLKSPLFNCNTIFIDPDVVINRPVDIFENDFDIAVTERDLKGMPINTGVVFVKPDNKDKLIAFWGALLEKAKTYPFTKQRWFSDQMAVNDLIGSDHGLRVLKVLCRVYNASPYIEPTPEKLACNRWMAENAQILHFKGYRKDMQWPL